MRRKDRQFGEVSEKTRKNMQKIRSKDTSIEVALRKRLWHDGYRYRKNYKKLPGSPDIAIMKHKIALIMRRLVTKSKTSAMKYLLNYQTDGFLCG